LLVHAFRKDGKAQPPVRLKGNVAAGSSFTFTLNYSSTGTSADLKQVVGDVNGDAKVDCTDVAVVRAAFGKKAGQPGFNPSADLNVDSVVDVRDLLAVTQHLPVGSACGPTLTIAKSGAGQGIVTSAPSGINCGGTCSAQFKEQTQVILTAAPATNSTFLGWTGDCTGSATDTTVMMSADRACTARFGVVTKALTVLLTGGGGGSVRSSPGGIDCSLIGICSAPFPVDSSVTLTAFPAQFSVFRGWSGDRDCLGAAPSITVRLTRDMGCVARFEPEPVSVLYQAHVQDLGWLSEVPTLPLHARQARVEGWKRSGSRGVRFQRF
jgi:hypothetical protein